MKISNPTDFWAGLMFAVIGFTFALIAYGLKFGETVILAGYAMGTPARMGPAFFPFWLGLLLTGIGIAIAVGGLRTKGRPVEKFHWGPIGFVLGAVVLFGVLLKPLGMPISGLILIFVASLGSHDFHWKPVAILAVALVIFSMLVFIYGLKLPVPICPAVDALQDLRICRV